MIFNLIILFGLVKLLLLTQKPFLCSGIYAVITLALSLLFENQLMPSLTVAVLSFALASLYFWILNRLEGSGIIWWIACAAGGLFIFF